MRAPTATGRNYAIDWLRVLAILMIFVFHTTRFFDPTDWHVKNPQTYPALLVFIQFLGLWGMPLIFVVSGASTFYSVSKRSPVAFVMDRTLRLLVPLGFSLVTHIAVQAYLEQVTHGRFRGSFLEYLPRYFSTDLYRDYNWLGFHLWYLGLLYLFSVLLLPLCVWLARGAGGRWLDRAGDWLSRWGGVYLLALPIMALSALIPPISWWGGHVFGGWSLTPYIVFYLYGFILVANAGLQHSVQRLRWLSLGGGLILFLGLLTLYVSRGEPFFGSSYYTFLFGFLGLTAWFWVLAIWGFAQARLNFGAPILWYANEAVLPFYILHQTVLLVVGYFVVRWPIPDPLKFVVIGLGALTIILSLYWFLIRPFNPLRFLFGLKPASRTPQRAIALSEGGAR